MLSSFEKNKLLFMGKEFETNAYGMCRVVEYKRASEVFVEFEHQGIVYPSTENFYQAIKYDKDDFCPDVDYLITVRNYLATIKPNEAKKYSRKHQMTNPKFEVNKLKIMLYAQRKKYSQEPFKFKLLDTGDCYTEEGNYWNDSYWGTDMKTRKGENNLGKIIMQVRDELREGKQNV